MNPKNMPMYFPRSNEKLVFITDIEDGVRAIEPLRFECEVTIYCKPDKRDRIKKIVKGERKDGATKFIEAIFKKV